MKKFSFIIFFILSVQLHGQVLKTYRFEELEELVRTKPRPILLYFYTNNCVYCKLLTQATFKNNAVVQKLNNYYYVVFFNAEETATVNFKNNVFTYVSKSRTAGYHQIVEAFLKNRQEIYPTLIFLDHNFNELLFLQSYITPSQMLEIL